MKRNPGGREHDDGSGADAPLHDALDDLETMLGQGGAPDAGPRSAPPGGALCPAALIDEAQGPGAAPPAAVSPAASDAMAEPQWQDPELYGQVAQRLASELEIIMNARLESALQGIGEDIRREVRNHIEIVLPEIVSDLALAAAPPRHE